MKRANQDSKREPRPAHAECCRVIGAAAGMRDAPLERHRSFVHCRCSAAAAAAQASRGTHAGNWAVVDVVLEAKSATSGAPSPRALPY